MIEAFTIMYGLIGGSVAYIESLKLTKMLKPSDAMDYVAIGFFFLSIMFIWPVFFLLLGIGVLLSWYRGDI